MNNYNPKGIDITLWKKGRRRIADYAGYCVSIIRNATAGTGNGTLKGMRQKKLLLAEKNTIPHDFGFEQTVVNNSNKLTVRIKERAQQIVNHKVDLLGRSLIDVSKEGKANRMLQNPFVSEPQYRRINWHMDFQSGYEWHRLCMPQVTLRTYRHHTGVDVKWPWELSRFQHLTVLPLASRMVSLNHADGTDVFWPEFRYQTSDWITANPLGLGVNWACEMEVAIRAVNWIIALLCFGRQINSNEEAWSRLFWNSVREHGKFLYKRLRKFGDLKKGNHYIAELAGLFLLGLLCPCIPESRQWLYFSREGLEREILSQVQTDGTHWENSSFYHLLVTEMFLYTGLIADSFDCPFSDTYRRIVEKMVSVVSLISSSRYVMPQIGDSDSGYFLKPININATHSRAGHTIAIGRSYLGCDHKRSPKEALATILLIEKQELPCIHPGYSAQRMPVFLENSGWIILEQGPIKVVMCLGPRNIRQKGGHAHEDTLSISLFWNGVPVVVDPGTYVYTGDPATRNRLRAANRHNQPQTMLPEKDWINRAVFASLLVYERVEWEKLSMGSMQQGIVAHLTGRNNGIHYTLSRKIVLDALNKNMTIEDDFKINVIQPLSVALCLHPNVTCSLGPKGVFAIKASEVSLEFKSQPDRFIEQQGEYSSTYGSIDRTSWLVWRQRAKGTKIVWTFYEKHIH